MSSVEDLDDVRMVERGGDACLLEEPFDALRVVGTRVTNPDSESTGTYEVTPNCTGIIPFQPLPGVLIEERMVIVDNGREIRAAVMVPTAVVMTSVHQRIDRR